MAEHEALGNFAALGSEKDLASALDFDVAIASHALDGGGDGGRSDVELFGETSADGDLIFLAHLPDGLEVVFLRNAGLLSAQRVSVETRDWPLVAVPGGVPRARGRGIRSLREFSDKWRGLGHRDLRRSSLPRCGRADDRPAPAG